MPKRIWTLQFLDSSGTWQDTCTGSEADVRAHFFKLMLTPGSRRILNPKGEVKGEVSLAAMEIEFEVGGSDRHE